MAKERKKLATKRKEKLSEEGADNEDAKGKKEFVKAQEQSAASMLEFLEKARKGEMLPSDAIIQFAKCFPDDLTLDNIPRMQLINMCKYMNIPPYGSDAILAFQLRHRIRTLKEDDQRILWEGIDSLTKMELREACQERGMRSTGLSKAAYKNALQQWLDLSVNKEVPVSLLIMSRTFFLREEMSPTAPAEDDESKSVASLADAISGLDKDVVNEVVLEIATPEEVQSDPSVRRIKLEVLEAQNEKILEERAERDAANKKKEEKEREETEEQAEKAALAVSEDTAGTDMSAGSLSSDETTTTKDGLSVTISMSEGTTTEGEPKLSVEDISIEDTREKGDLSASEIEAIAQLLHPDPVSGERQDLERLKAALNPKDEDDAAEKDTTEDMSDGESAWSPGETTGGTQPIIAATDDQTAGAGTTAAGAATGAAADAVEDEAAAETIAAMDAAADAEANASTKMDLSVEVPPNEAIKKITTDGTVTTVDSTDDEEESGDEHLDSTIERLKSRVSKMVDNIELQLDDVQGKIGDKLHFLDKDCDGIMTSEEMAHALQAVLKRDLSHEEAMDIAALMVSEPN